ncbi:anti-sigma B factor RsbW [Salisediminibacterium halotolerans]|uniref:anti-sigma B factor RsbW n=1 Tax=Salisediminibacterium halotolerans TaxID=517425 RepID=UPI000EB1E9D6|nr:anti-sigma B factor RsbW [Salisediminibacterium halotolerans]RLJ73303.1 serine/threonine-protein kinase RsbW [Actinophytocola xinjiangensis]RPE86725.1 serine/threonine-protein kinase RsbW [Salisediminibacterium halotolerans]TWG34100.1 serine/threonine-protein kinase RsbW [Salisediminibacterium halotolerans]GEL07614.1 serine-protein kinase RsbW [Salisediminibacterium halotolerans]
MTGNTDFIEMTVPAKPEYVGVVRLSVSGIANRLGYSYDDIEDIKIAIAEACTNVVNHAYEDGQKENNMHLSFTVHEDRLELIVADQGGAIDVEALREGRGPVSKEQSVEELKEGGLGLFLIETLMDQVDIHGENGVMITMTKFLHRDEVDQHGSGFSEEIPKQ